MIETILKKIERIEKKNKTPTEIHMDVNKVFKYHGFAKIHRPVIGERYGKFLGLPLFHSKKLTIESIDQLKGLTRMR